MTSTEIYDTAGYGEKAGIAETVPVSEKKSVSKRSSGIDIIKIFAAVLVVMVHFFMNTAFYSTIPIDGIEYLPSISVFWIAYTCVPLFMITTGYLMKNKTLSGKYYLGIIKVIVFYLTVSTICLINKVKNGVVVTPWEILRGYVRFGHCDYSWYVEQYIVIFMFIPFLNMAFNGLRSRRQHTALLVTAVFFFSVASSFYLGFDPNDQIKPFPEFPIKAYPIAYYYIGCYIRQYPPKKKNFGIWLTAASLALLTLSLYFQSKANENHFFRSYHFFEYNSYPVVGLASGIFLLLFDIKFNNRFLVKILSIIAQTSLLTYLISILFDSRYYGEFNNKYPYPDFLLRFRHMYEIVPKVYFMSLLWSLVILDVYTIISLIIKHFLKKRRLNEISI